MTELEMLRRYFPVYVDCLAPAQNLEHAERLLREQHGIGRSRFAELIDNARLLVQAEERNSANKATIIGQ